jgi:hypothetical protein
VVHEADPFVLGARAHQQDTNRCFNDTGTDKAVPRKPASDPDAASTLKEIAASVMGQLPGDGQQQRSRLGGFALAAVVHEDGKATRGIVGGAAPRLQWFAGLLGLGEDVVDEASPLGETAFDVAGALLEDGARPAVVAL